MKKSSALPALLRHSTIALALLFLCFMPGANSARAAQKTTLAEAAINAGADVVSAQSLAEAVKATLSQQAKLTPSDGAQGDFFGSSVSLSKDRALVGAHGSGELTGAAYIFVFDGTAWIQEAKLTAASSARGDNFGSSVSLSGGRALVGAYSSANGVGSAYIFAFDGATWSQEAKLTASDGTANDFFGYSVSLSGDRALIGAVDDSVSATNSGSAYVFTFNGTAWSQQAKLTASDGAARAYFGNSVSLSGDRALVGAYGADGSAGAAYVFASEGTTWNQQAKLSATDGRRGDDFGFSVALSGDRALIGAYNDDANGVQSGSAYIFNFDGTAWSEQAKLIPSDGAAYDQFGGSVALSGRRALVGADELVSSGVGSAYLFAFDGVTWSQRLKLTPADGMVGDNFGISVSLTGKRALVGSHRSVVNGVRSGSAYLFGR